MSALVPCGEFFQTLNRIDGRPLPDVIEPYRRHIFEQALDAVEPDGRPRFNMVLCGRAKKNWKSADLILAAFFKLPIWESPYGNDCSLLANDEGQAADDLSRAKKLVEANEFLRHEVEVRAKEIGRKESKGMLRILPARDVAGAPDDHQIGQIV